MQEIWRDIPDYEGLYQVSNLGRVKSLNYNHTKSERVLCNKKHKSKYLTVTLCKDGCKKNKSIHVLVATAFIQNNNNYPCVNHLDGDKGNNCVTNLEWCDHKQNIAHAIQHGLANHHAMLGRKGVLNSTSKPVLQFDKEGNFVKKWYCTSDAARYYGMRPANITNCCKGRNKTLKGFVWKYAED